MEVGSNSPTKTLAVVIMAYGIRDTLVAAVRSILTQEGSAEVIVVHSGPGNPSTLFSDAGIEVKVIHHPDRLRPGGTRNLGISSTSAPYVAFLADDCFAMPGWIKNRLLAHAEGAHSVASSLDCHAPWNPIALAGHVCLFVNRMPKTPRKIALRYGASYSREVFRLYGYFDDSLESGEDTEFHQRLQEIHKPRWHPEVISVHHGTEKLSQFMAAQYRRGMRMAEAMEALSEIKAKAIAWNALSRTRRTISTSWKVVGTRYRLSLIAAVPLIILGNCAYALGAFSKSKQP
jgi:glycosyltransferase involved in cell wall biosynthesis